MAAILVHPTAVLCWRYFVSWCQMKDARKWPECTWNRSLYLGGKNYDCLSPEALYFRCPQTRVCPPSDKQGQPVTHYELWLFTLEYLLNIFFYCTSRNSPHWETCRVQLIASSFWVMSIGGTTAAGIHLEILDGGKKVAQYGWNFGSFTHKNILLEWEIYPSYHQWQF